MRSKITYFSGGGVGAREGKEPKSFVDREVVNIR